MSNEISLSINLQVNNGNFKFQSTPQSFKDDQSVANGLVPGAIVVTTSAVEVVLSTLTVPGWVYIYNYDSTNYVSIGLWIGGVFYPFGEVGPGKPGVFKLARDILTANTNAAKLYLKANTATCHVLVAAMEK